MYALMPLQVFRLRKWMCSVTCSGRSEAEKSPLIREEFERLKKKFRHTLNVLDGLTDKELPLGDMERILKVMHNITEYL